MAKPEIKLVKRAAQTKGGTPIYYIVGTTPDGTRIKKSTRTSDKTLAQQIFAQFHDATWKRHIYGAEETVTFDEAALIYAQDGGETRFLLKVAEYFEGTLIKSITPIMVRKGAELAYPNATNSTRNRQFIVPASAVINFAHDQGWCNPIKVKKLPEEIKEREAVDFDYIDRIIPHCAPHLAALVLFINQTGRRVSEAIALERGDIDFQTGAFHCARTKNGEPFDGVISRGLLDFIAKLPEKPLRRRTEGKEYPSPIFGYASRTAVYKPLKAAAEAAGVKYHPTHEIGRHSFATNLRAAGWSFADIAEVGGWKDLRMVRDRYAHVDPKKAAALAITDGAGLSKISKK